MIDKFWNLAVRQLYYMDFISRSDMIKIYGSYNSDLIVYDGSYKAYYLLVIDILKNKPLIHQLIKEEIDIIADMKLPSKKIFKKMWLSYILDCVINGSLPDTDIPEYETKIDFSNELWLDNEINDANHIIDMVRLDIIGKNPRSIEYMEHLSFDILININKIG